jgi:hypothetical protein
MWSFFQDLAGILLGVLAFLGVLLIGAVDGIRLWAYDNPDIIYGIGVAAIACGIVAFLVRALWRRWLRDIGRLWYWKFLQRPYHRVTAPVRRLHRRWSERNMEKKMAKWKAGTLADIVGDALLEANLSGIISDQEYRKYMEKMGKVLGLTDLVRIRNSKLAIAHRIRNNDTAKHGPKPGSYIPGGKPGEDIVPQWEGLGSKALAKLKKTS